MPVRLPQLDCGFESRRRHRFMSDWIACPTLKFHRYCGSLIPVDRAPIDLDHNTRESRPQQLWSQSGTKIRALAVRYLTYSIFLFLLVLVMPPDAHQHPAQADSVDVHDLTRHSAGMGGRFLSGTARNLPRLSLRRRRIGFRAVDFTMMEPTAHSATTLRRTFALFGRQFGENVGM